jgi:uncharacterized protein (DUF169 family)
VVGETACADSWGRALKTGEPSLSLPCFAERRYGGVPDEEMLMALRPEHLAKAIVGMKQLAKNGLRYPIAPYGIQADVRAGMAADLNTLLRLKTTVIGMKMFASVEEMTAIPKIRRPTAVHTTDQIVSMASRLGWTVGITADDLVGAQCRAVIGLAPTDEKFLEGQSYVGVWHGTAEDARKRQEALDVVAFGKYQALAVSPLSSGRLNPPDICLVYATPGQMIILINGLQYTGYKKFEWGVVGETACADSWGRALKTGEPSLSLPCFAERRYGGVPDEEMLMALQPAHLAKAITGMKQLAKNGLRYPIAPYGIQADVRAGMGASYAGKK